LAESKIGSLGEKYSYFQRIGSEIKNRPPPSSFQRRLKIQIHKPLPTCGLRMCHLDQKWAPGSKAQKAFDPKVGLPNLQRALKSNIDLELGEPGPTRRPVIIITER
jgi:hypothetical protein